ncbi:glycine receptor subunit alphaZ1-like isoform X2 [Limulus polyphemus]|uniref:Glycine receptor subunit alphaZ1-like isoform X2 n=1 Tax=Limulus polyphemus TaxID=6850 RepID=A0ABM1S9M8_LIMPO|nr:glycine receptor subunit alphaZ1-like isoform X2 [Limulus polyphemus]
MGPKVRKVRNSVGAQMPLLILSFFIFVTIFLGSESRSPSSAYLMYEDNNLIVLDELLQNYDRRVTPTHHISLPTTVKCELYLRSIGAINPATMDYEVDLYLRQTWHDERLRSNNLTRPLDLNDPVLVKRLWRPDIYFPNAKHGEFQYVTVPNVLLRINPNGDILYMLRLKLTFSCMMEMERYPLDAQSCDIELASFSKTVREVKLQWLNKDSVLMNKDLKLAQFELKQVSLTECKESFQIDSSSGKYSCLRAKLDLKRSIGHYLVQYYLPSTLIVFISWVSFWLDVDAIPARITLGVTTLLTISSESSDQQSHLAPVSYVKALDVWMGTCTFFVFAALIEFTFVSYLARKRRNIQEVKTEDGEMKTTLIVPISSLNETLTNLPTVANFKEVSTLMLLPARGCAKRIDKTSRIVFPLGFLIFNTLYWPYYLY